MQLPVRAKRPVMAKRLEGLERSSAKVNTSLSISVENYDCDMSILTSGRGENNISEKNI
jgi:hypothetical protein